MNGFQLKKLRELNNYTQDFMAKKLGISQQNYSKMEKKQKNFSEEKTEKLSEILNTKKEQPNQFPNAQDEHIVIFQDVFVFSGTSLNIGVSNNVFTNQDPHLQDLKS
jgi:transcriptional regulator with XRE-family HTH domain